MTLEFQDDSGQIISEQRTVGAGSRDTIYCDNVIPAISFSTKVTSTNGEPILVERAMYFNFKGRLDGHAGAAVCEPSASWYFGEGYTGY